MDLNEYQMVAPGYYIKYNPMTGVKTEIWRKARTDGGFDMKVRHSQRVDQIIDANLEQQSNFNGYHKSGLRHVARLPITEWNKIREATGWKPGQGYDEVALRRYLNDRDNYKLKTIPKAV